MNLRNLTILLTIAGATAASAQSFRVKITTGMSPLNDEAVVNFNAGVPTTDPADVPKVGLGGGPGPTIASVSADGADLTYNAYGQFTADIALPFKVSGPVTGNYAITIYNVQDLFGGSCIVLEDLIAGISTPINAGTAYPFTLDVNDPIDPARFVFHVTAALQAAIDDATCSTMSDGTITVPVTGIGPWSVTCTDAQGALVQQFNCPASPVEVAGLAEGEYSVVLADVAGCQRTVEAMVGAVQAPLADFVPSALQVSVNEPVVFSNGSIGHTSSEWNFGDGGQSTDESPTHVFTAPGAYAVDLTVSNGPCSSTAGTTLQVTNATAVAEVDPLEARVFVSADHISVQCPYAAVPTNAALFSANGRAASAQQRSIDGQTPMFIPTTGLAAGGYVLRVWNTEGMRSYMVPLAR